MFIVDANNGLNVIAWAGFTSIVSRLECCNIRDRLSTSLSLCSNAMSKCLQDKRYHFTTLHFLYRRLPNIIFATIEIEFPVTLTLLPIPQYLFYAYANIKSLPSIEHL